MPEFTEFSRQGARSGGSDPMFTLQARGLISFNQAAYEALGEPAAVALLYDPKDGVVALRIVPKAHENAYTVRKQQQAQSYLVGAQGFVAHYGIPTRRARRFTGRDYGDGVWGFDLNEGVAVQNRRGGQAGPPVTDCWRVTSDGFEVPGLMNMNHKAMSHPGYMRQPGQEPPLVRLGMLVACGPLGEDQPTSEIRGRLLGFLTYAPLMELINALTVIGPGVTWVPWGGHGRYSFEAAMTGDSDREAPFASGLLVPPQGGAARYGSDSRFAELVLDIEPRGPQGGPAQAADLAAWHDRLARALKLPALFEHFLANELGLSTSDDPPAQVGVWLKARNITDLVDIKGLRTVRGSMMSNQFTGWALADPNGKEPGGTSLDWLTSMCDHTLHLDGYESVLADIEAAE
jgi:hypothetical protein